jgi:hypothetical protein
MTLTQTAAAAEPRAAAEVPARAYTWPRPGFQDAGYARMVAAIFAREGYTGAFLRLLAHPQDQFLLELADCIDALSGPRPRHLHAVPAQAAGGAS